MVPRNSCSDLPSDNDEDFIPIVPPTHTDKRVTAAAAGPNGDSITPINDAAASLYDRTLPAPNSQPTFHRSNLKV